MPQMVFISLPVADLPRSTAFYEALGFARDPQFSDASTACLVVSEAICFMLMTHDKFRQFSPRPVADPRAGSEMLLCLSADSRAAVDTMVDRAGEAGGGVDPAPVDDHGFMYGRSFEDPDGHMVGVTWMDLAAATKAMAECRTGEEAVPPREMVDA